MLLKLDELDAAGVLVSAAGAPAFRVGYHLSLRGAALAPIAVEVEGRSARARFRGSRGEEALVEDSFAEAGGLVALRRRWTFSRPGPWGLGASFSAELPGAEAFVPAVLYRGNEAGKGAFPKSSDQPFWSFLETRSPLPCCAQLHNGGSSLLCAAEPARAAGLLGSARATASGGRARIAIDIPGREGPRSYLGKTLLASAEARGPEGLRFPEGELPASIERVFFCALADIEGRSHLSAYRDFVEALPAAAAALGREGPAPAATPAPRPALVSWEEYEARKTAHLLSLVEAAPGGSAYLAMGRGNGALQAIYDYTAGSFLVKSLEGALVLARSPEPPELASPYIDRLTSALGLRPGPGLLAELAERIGRFFLDGELAPGLHQDCRDLKRGIWGGYLGISENDEFRPMVNARCNGEVMASYLRLYEELSRRGRKVPEFIELPKRVARFYLDRQLGGERAGSFGRWWSAAGESVNALGTNGAYVASFLAALEPHFEDPARISSAIEAAGRYYAGLAERGEFFADTLDADSCDKEAGAALLALFLDLHERDGGRAWLDHARMAAEFLLSWIWQYDCPFPPGSPLGSRSFSTRGMSSVSVAHHHLDFYGMSIAYDFLRYAERSGDGLYRAQAELLLRACRQLVAGPEDWLGRGPEEVGWQPEQINHTEWDYFDRPDRRAGHFDIDIAWVTVLGLGGYQRVKARYPEALEAAGREGR